MSGINVTGATTSLAQQALQYVLLRPVQQRSIGTLLPQVVVRERHTDEIEMTDHPVEAGATITDHAFKLPAVVIIECGFGSSGSSSSEVPFALHESVDLNSLYYQFLQLQDPPTLLDVVTGKRIYSNMLLKTLIVETDKETENVLMITATLRQVIMATTQDVTVAAPASDQAAPESTQSITDTGTNQLAYTPIDVGVSGPSS